MTFSLIRIPSVLFQAIAVSFLCFQVIAATTQGIPQNIPPPRVTAPSAAALHVSWHVPPKPNGVIKEYQLRQVGKGLIYTGTADKRQHTVTGKKKKKKKQEENLPEESVTVVRGAKPPRGGCVIDEVTSRGRVLLTYGQVPLIHANRRAHTGSNKPQQQITSEIIYIWLWYALCVGFLHRY